MGKVLCDISMSLDGFITGPNDSIEHHMGVGGERLHEWIYNLQSWRELHGFDGGETSRDSDMLKDSFSNSGTVIIGRRMFNHGEQPWGDDPPFHKPVFVVTHHARETLIKSDTTFTFVADGIESALRQARTAAGDKNVLVLGGASIIQQFLQAGLLDEMHLHLAPVLMGNGVRLFENLDMPTNALQTTEVVQSADVTHFKFQVMM